MNLSETFITREFFRIHKNKYQNRNQHDQLVGIDMYIVKFNMII